MKLARPFVVAVLALVLVASASIALADDRVALVVGNSTYAHIGRLPNAENDAADMSAALRRRGFEVTTELDADRVELTEALRAFTRRSVGADVALVFYAGHGIEMDGGNYLVPVDARLERDLDVRYETVTLEDMLASTLGASLRLVILDACRNNPLARSMQRTLAGRSVSGGSFGDLNEDLLGDETLVAYAAAAGTTAADGRGRNSPYTSALLAHLEQPLEIGLLFRRVRAQVLAATNGQQRPHEYQSLVGEHYLGGALAVTSVAVDAVEPAATTASGVVDAVAVDAVEPDLAARDVVELDIAQLRLMAEQGDARARRELGERYEEGRGVVRDYEAAVTWYGRAAEQGDVGAQGNLGAMYSNGTGVPRDDEVALTWFRRAAEQGGARGQNGLGALYREGLVVPQDDEEAVRWFRLAAEQGYARGLSNLGWMYSNGRGVRRDEEEAGRWFRLAAERFRRAAERGDLSAQFSVGNMYRDGFGVSQNYEAAVAWFRRVAEQGDARAQHNLGAMYRDGRGVSQDYRAAVEWIRLAAEQGESYAQNSLGSLYRDGQGVSRDDGAAVAWYRRAAEQGNGAGQSSLGYMYEEGRGVDRNRETAVRWYRRAAEQGDVWAQNRLGIMYDEGRGVDRGPGGCGPVVSPRGRPGLLLCAVQPRSYVRGRSRRAAGSRGSCPMVQPGGRPRA